MDLLKINLFKGGIFKQAKFLVSTPQQAQKVVYISDAGTVSMELLPSFTGFLSADGIKKAWFNLHNLKMQVYKGDEKQEESVLIISDRSYLPLDPHNTLKPKTKAELASLKDIAKLRHAEQRMDAGAPEGRSTIQELIINGCFILIGILIVGKLIAIFVGGN